MNEEQLEQIMLERLAVLQRKGLDIRIDYTHDYISIYLNGKDYGTWTIYGILNIISRYTRPDINVHWFKIMKMPLKLNEV